MRTFLAILIFLASLSSALAASYAIKNWPEDLNKGPMRSMEVQQRWYLGGSGNHRRRWPRHLRNDF